ncbi:hypothetical protein [Microbacterium sp. NPDC089696]|uniref:hypothetical protein n=1 Tax=Microbacterium sp. NPDC089696 TaxID=3364199 RepID=UPI003808FF67
MSAPVNVTLRVTTSDPEIVARAAEHFSRVAAGLALEGVHTFMMCGPDEEDD